MLKAFTPAASPSKPGGAAPPSSPWVAYLVAGAFFMENLDGTVITTALPAMARSFETTAVNLQIGVSAYLTTLAVFILASGWITERFGGRHVFATAIAVFTLASVLCGLSTSVWMFVASRVLQGVGGAMMVPVGRLVVLRGTPKTELMRAIAILTWPALTAPILGPPVGGFITQVLSWHWIFFLNVPIGVVGFLLALRLVPQSPGEPRRFDLTGFVLAACACLALMHGFDLMTGQTIPWGEVVLTAVVTVALGGSAIWHLRRTEHPLLEFSSLAIPSYAVTIQGGTLFRVVTQAVPFLLPLLFQLGFGLDPTQSGLLVLFLFAGNMGMKPFTSRILKRFGFRQVILVNGLLQAATILGCALLAPDTPWPVIAALLVASGATRSMSFTAINTLAFVDVPEPRMSAANILFTMLQQLGLGLGVAVGAVLLRFGGYATGSGATSSLADFHVAFACVAVLAALSIVDALALPRDAGAVVSGHKRAT